MSKRTLRGHGHPTARTSGRTSGVGADLQQAQTLHRAGQYSQAAALYQKILHDHPTNFDALTMFAMLAFQCGRSDDALQLLERALQVNPTSANAWANHGNVLNALRRHEEALASLDHALVLQEKFPEAWLSRGIVLRELGRVEEAVASYDRALELKHGFTQAWNNRGNALEQMERWEEALESFDHALKREPRLAEAWYNRGNVLRTLGRHKEALASWDRAQAINPDYANAHYNEGLCRLLLGDYERGWEKYEWRLRGKIREGPRSFTQPLWLGKEDIAGKTILLHAEQGYGDTIQFCRYVRHVATLGATVLLEVQPALVSLLEGLAGASQVLARGTSLPPFDCHTPLLSLPLAFMGKLGTTIPQPDPYLVAPAAKMESWRGEIGDADGLRIGMAWSGSPTHANDRNRSMRLTELVPLLDIAGVTFISLHQEVRDHDQALLTQTPRLRHYGPRLQDFSDTAALIATLDLVITVDTVIAHLAGALGKPVWILLAHDPDWRWLLERSDSPWYSTAKLYRQSVAGDWSSVTSQVAKDLQTLCVQR